jgi:hypothetical protein
LSFCDTFVEKIATTKARLIFTSYGTAKAGALIQSKSPFFRKFQSFPRSSGQALRLNLCRKSFIYGAPLRCALACGARKWLFPFSTQHL